jgi:hypothetical protein
VRICWFVEIATVADDGGGASWPEFEPSKIEQGLESRYLFFGVEAQPSGEWLLPAAGRMAMRFSLEEVLPSLALVVGQLLLIDSVLPLLVGRFARAVRKPQSQPASTRGCPF